MINNKPNGTRRRIVQPKLAGKAPVETRPAPPVYRPQLPAVSNPAPGAVMQRKTDSGFRSETRPAPPVYQPQVAGQLQQKSALAAPPVYKPVQLKPAGPPIYRPQAGGKLQRKEGVAAPPVYRPQMAAQQQSKNSPVQRSATHQRPAVQRNIHGLVAGQSNFGSKFPVSHALSAVTQKVAGVSVAGSHSHFGIPRSSRSFTTIQRAQMAEIEYRQTQIFGMLTVHLDCPPGKNHAEIHVVGQLGGSLKAANLIQAFSWLYEKMKMVEKADNVKGIVEFHPTGAVVTLKLMELLAGSLGGWYHAWQGNKARNKRKDQEKKNPVERDKFAEKIDRDMHEEYIENLKSIKGAKGVSIMPVTIKKSKAVEEFEAKVAKMDLEEKNSPEVAAEFEKLWNQSMLEDSALGTARWDDYMTEFQDQDEELPAPSMVVKLNVDQLPKLIGTLKKHAAK